MYHRTQTCGQKTAAVINCEYLGGPELTFTPIDSANSLLVFSTCEFLPYQVQTRTAPEDPWLDFGSVIAGNGQIQTVIVPLNSAEPLRMYRVKMTPPGY